MRLQQLSRIADSTDSLRLRLVLPKFKNSTTQVDFSHFLRCMV